MKIIRFERLLLVGLTGAALLTACMPGDTSSSSDESAALRVPGNGHDDKDDSGNGGGVAKVYICHIPPGNPANAHTIHVGAPAVPAHLAHGDYIGKCADIAPSDSGKDAPKGHTHWGFGFHRPDHDKDGHEGDDHHKTNPPPVVDTTKVPDPTPAPGDSGFAG